MMHVAHVKSIEIDCTLKWVFYIDTDRYSTEEKISFTKDIPCLFNASHVSNKS